MGSRTAELEFVAEINTSAKTIKPKVDSAKVLAAIERCNLHMEEIEMTLPVGFEPFKDGEF